jgi:hypothetical protein
MANVKLTNFEKVASVGVTPMQLNAIRATAKRRRWSQASFIRYAIVKELLSAGTYNPNEDPNNDEDFDDLILEKA